MNHSHASANICCTGDPIVDRHQFNVPMNSFIFGSVPHELVYNGLLIKSINSFQQRIEMWVRLLEVEQISPRTSSK